MTNNVIGVGDTGQVIPVPIERAIPVSGVQIPGFGGARKLDDLTDVEGADDGLPGQGLVKQLDGMWRPGTVSGGGGPVGLVWVQSTPAASWAITHDLGRYPQVTVLSTSGNRILPDLDYGSPNALTITHAEPLAGTAILT